MHFSVGLVQIGLEQGSIHAERKSPKIKEKEFNHQRKFRTVRFRVVCMGTWALSI